MNVRAIHALAIEISPVLGQIRRHIQHEGEASVIDRYDKTSDTTELKPVSAELVIERTELQDFNSDKLEKYLRAVAEQLAGGATKLLVDEMNRVTSKYDGVVHGGEKSLDEELLLEVMASIEHAFNADGTWIRPIFFVPQETAARLAHQPEMLEATQVRLQDILGNYPVDVPLARC